MTTHLVFVYGTLRARQSNHRVMERVGAVRVSKDAVSTEPAFTMRDLGAYPAIFRDGSTSITGEVYEVDDDGLRELDIFEGVPTLYSRERVRLTDGTKAWAYVMKGRTQQRQHGNEVISGDWVEYLKGNDPEESEDRTLYFAFGSNLVLEQMLSRCPSAEVVGRAILKGYRLAFAGHSIRWGGGVATVLPTRGSFVEGVIYSLTWDDLIALDRHEGHPRHYRRSDVAVAFNEDGEEIRAWTYRLPATEAPPSPAYLSAILDGYAELEMNPAPVENALKRAKAAKAALPLAWAARVKPAQLRTRGAA